MPLSCIAPLNMMNKFFLVGIPGSGKTTLGRRTADILQIPFFDTDVMVKNKLGGVAISDLFRSSFSTLFIEEQEKSIAQFAETDTPSLIATGAEVGLIPQCIKYMNNMGYIIHIKRSPDAILEFQKSNGKSGLILYNETDGTKIDMQEKSVRIYAESLLEYDEIADRMLDNNGNEDEGAEKLKVMIEELSGDLHAGSLV